jgi:hydrogenase expression/formation protein HypC
MCLAIPGKIVKITERENPLERSGKISFGGILKEVNLAYVPEAEINNYVIVHAGFAISILDEEEAQQTLADLNNFS